MLSKSPSRPKSETVIGGGLCPDTWATAFNDSYVGTCRSCAFGQEKSSVIIPYSGHLQAISIPNRLSNKWSKCPSVGNLKKISNS